MAETSLFGATPDSIQRERDAAMQQEAFQYAKLDPFQRATAGLYAGGQRLGGAIGGLLGGVDPEIQRATQRQELSKGLMVDDPSSYMQAAQKAAQMGDYGAARELSAQAQAMQMKRAQLGSEQALAAQRLREKEGADPFQQLLRAGKYTPASVADYRESGDPTVLTLVDKEAAPSELAKLLAEQAKLDPVANKASYDAYTAKIKKLTTGKSMGEEIGEGVSKAFGLLGDVLKPALKEEGKGIGEFATKDYNTLANAVAAAPASKRNVRILKENLDVAFTGAFADAKKGVSSALIGLGLPIGDDIRNAVSGTELINAMGTRYVFPLVKNFPGSLAAKELDRLEKTAPNTLQQPETIKRLVSLLEADIAENEFTYKRAKDYRTNKKSLIGFDAADQKIEFQQKYSQLQDLVSAVRAKKSQTSSEAAQINALRKELGL